jgi:drug/metabolite transporter (DMT)-like permease
MIIGIVAGLLTGALWGLTFVAPRIVLPYTEIDLAIMRYAIFGLTSLMLMLHPAFRPGRITGKRFLIAIILGVTGYVGYYLCAAYAVRLAGAAIPPLIIGALPVLLAIIGNWNDKDVPWRLLALPLSLIALGLLIINGATLAQAESPEARGSLLLGLVSAIAALLIWLVYAIINARVMRAPDAPASLPWTGLQGIGSGLGVLPLIPFIFIGEASALPDHALSSSESVRFWTWVLILGIAGSWLATWFWVIASKRLPLALSAQLIVSETVFALIYGFAYEARWPTSAEWTGITLQLIGVIAAVALFTRKKPVAHEPETNVSATLKTETA